MNGRRALRDTTRIAIHAERVGQPRAWGRPERNIKEKTMEAEIVELLKEIASRMLFTMIGVWAIAGILLGNL